MMNENIFKHSNLYLIITHHLLLIYGIYEYGFNVWIALSLFAYTIFFSWIISFRVVHMRFSHTRYKDSVLNYFLTFIVLFSGFGSPLSFSSLHRLHHKYCDTERDPHSPKHIGWFRVYFLQWNLENITPSIIRDYISSKFQMFVHHNWIKIHLLLMIILWAIDPRLVIFIVSPIVASTLHYAGIINVRGHLYGEARDVPETILIQPVSWRHKEHHGNF
jgi:stearoyl-CoA desaturase (delta-9 desaturase)